MRKINRYIDQPILKEFLDIIYKFGIPETSRKSGISETTIRFWTKGGVCPSLTIASKLLEELGYQFKIEKK